VLARFNLRVVTSGQSVFGGLDAPRHGEAATSPLSEDQIGILRLVACGTPLHEIAEVLGLLPRAVLAHVKNVYRQLGVRALPEPEREGDGAAA
jgi:DNA-binding NarL/FixJ family response regulator